MVSAWLPDLKKLTIMMEGEGGARVSHSERRGKLERERDREKESMSVGDATCLNNQISLITKGTELNHS